MAACPTATTGRSDWVMAAMPFLSGFESLATEAIALTLEWEGRAPAWLAGGLIRPGPALFEVGGKRCRHWFDGLAMLYRFALSPHGVVYTNRFLRTESFAAA